MPCLKLFRQPWRISKYRQCKIQIWTVFSNCQSVCPIDRSYFVYSFFLCVEKRQNKKILEYIWVKGWNILWQNNVDYFLEKTRCFWHKKWKDKIIIHKKLPPPKTCFFLQTPSINNTLSLLCPPTFGCNLLQSPF